MPHATGHARRVEGPSPSTAVSFPEELVARGFQRPLLRNTMQTAYPEVQLLAFACLLQGSGQPRVQPAVEVAH